jgi:hypothetical protein
LVLDVLFFGAEGFSCKLQFLIKKDVKNFQLYFFSAIFGDQNPGSGLDPDSLEMLDPDPYPDLDLMNLYPNNSAKNYSLRYLASNRDAVGQWAWLEGEPAPPPPPDDGRGHAVGRGR